MTTASKNWLPMPLSDGPPLPQFLGVYWPWYKKPPTTPPAGPPPTTGQYTLTININPPNSGTTSPRSGNYTKGQSVIVNAIPVGGYALDRWSGDISGTASSITVVMDKNKTITANFKAVSAPVANLTLTLRASPQTGGTITAVPTRVKYSFGDLVTLTATPASGYQFERWEQDGELAATYYQINTLMTKSTSLVAVFTKSTPTPGVAGPKFTVGDVIGIADDTYTVHAVSASTFQYILGVGVFPDDTVRWNVQVFTRANAAGGVGAAYLAHNASIAVT